MKRRRSSRIRSLGDKARVFDVGLPGRIGTVLRAGPEVSWVKWDDGAEQAITNQYLRPVKDQGRKS